VRGRVSFDTNILVYADDAAAGAKRDRVRQVIETPLSNGNGRLLTLVLQEYFAGSEASRKSVAKPREARGQGGGAECEANPPRVPI
jgi:hypothetical protein